MEKMSKNFIISDCCGASIIDESIDVCSDCKEHCILVTEEECFNEAMDYDSYVAVKHGNNIVMKNGKRVENENK
jgi:hypothetical protein